MKKTKKESPKPGVAYTEQTLPEYCDLLVSRDKRIGQVIKEIGYPPFWHRAPVFESLVMIILEQQVSLASAFAVFQKLKDRLGVINPKNILKMTDEDFKDCGFSRQKRTYVAGLAEEAASNRLNLGKIKLQDEETIRKELTRIKGIGQWTADIYLLSCLHKLDVFPVGDLALVKSMAQAGFIKPKDSKESILKKTEKYRPYRSIFTILMWHRYIRKNNIKVQFDL